MMGQANSIAMDEDEGGWRTNSGKTLAKKTKKDKTLTKKMKRQTPKWMRSLLVEESSLNVSI